MRALQALLLFCGAALVAFAFTVRHRTGTLPVTACSLGASLLGLSSVIGAIA